MSDPPAKAAPAATTPLTPVAVGTALAMAAQLVAGFAVGSTFRVPVTHGLALRFVRDPVAALVMGALAMGFTWLIARVAFRQPRPLVSAIVCVGAGIVAGGLTAFLALTVLSSIRGELELGPVMASSRKSMLSGFAVIPPGLCWSVVTAGVVAVTPRDKIGTPANIARAAWAGGLALIASSEAGLVLFRDMIVALLVTVVGLLLGLAAVGHGVRVDRSRLLPTFAVLAAVQGWIGLMSLYWRS